MATITITGSVTRIFYEGRGVEVTEFFKGRDGEMQQRKYTAWFEEAVTFDVGAEGSFTGLLATKLESFTNDRGESIQYVKVSANGATYTAKTAAPTTTPAAAQPPLDDMPF